MSNNEDNNNNNEDSHQRTDHKQTAELQQRMRRGDPEQQLLFWALEHTDPDLLHREKTKAEQRDAQEAMFLGKTREEIEESRKWLENALKEGVQVTAEDGKQRTIRAKNMGESLRQCVTILDNRCSSFGARVNALMEVEDSVDKIDFANDFAKMGGLQCLVRMLVHPEQCVNREKINGEQVEELQVKSLNVLGICAQNNPFVQGRLLLFQLKDNNDASEKWKPGHLIGYMLDRMIALTPTGDEKQENQDSKALLKKYIYACNCILSNNVSAPSVLIKFDQGLDRIMRLMKDPALGDQNRARLALMLFGLLCTEQDAKRTTLASELFTSHNIHRIVFDMLQESIAQDGKLELMERTLQLLQALTSRTSEEPFKSIVRAIRSESLAESSGFKAFRKKVLSTAPPADEMEDRWYDVRPYLEQIVLS